MNSSAMMRSMTIMRADESMNGDDFGVRKEGTETIEQHIRGGEKDQKKEHFII